MRINFLIIAVSFFLCVPVHAEDVSVSATVAANRLTLGKSTQLMVTVQGTQKVDPASLPPIDGFDARYVGPQTQVSIVNGNYASSKTFIYSLFPTKTGQFKIPSLSMTIDGKEYHTEPIDMSVDNAPANGPATASAGGAMTAESLKDKIMLIMGTSKNEAYVGEQIPVTVKLLYTCNREASLYRRDNKRNPVPDL
jgi:hypothetical protein